MRKSVLSFILLLAALIVRAVPADPTPYKYIQPDGSVIILQNHGDEFFHWTTDESGQIVDMDDDGFYRPVRIDLAAEKRKADILRSAMYSSWSSFDNPPVTNFGDRKVLCIIANFKNKSFTVENPNNHFHNMLNQQGYNLEGAIGSVRDYYIDNSSNQYRPEFDVYGPVTLSHDSKYYDDNGVKNAIIEAYDLLADQITIEDYDTDNDGRIDMVLFYFPGYNEAEGGPKDTIWPHQSTGDFGMLGTKRFVRYFCSSEFRGSSGEHPASIGTTCHEFAHSLGLPDFYDVDYEESGGKNSTTGPYDLMASGNYNDSGRRPPYLSAVERNILGWMPDPEGITLPGSYTLQPVRNNMAYMIGTSVPGEYFVLESRDTTKWDHISTLAPGLLVYHVDRSGRIIDAANGYTAAYLWENTNEINNYYGHPCYYLVPASGSASSWTQYVFPGTDNVSSYAPVDWTGASAGVLLSDIAHDGAVSTFTVTLSSHRMVSGTVKDLDGNPLEDALVSLTPSIGPFNSAPSLLPESISCLTDEAGHYSLVLEDDDATAYQILMARKDGYKAVSYNLTISSLFEEQDFTLLRNGEGEPLGLYKYDTDNDMTSFSWGEGSHAATMRFTASELAGMDAVGKLLKTVTFLASATNGETVYVVVDIGGDIVLRKDVTSQFTPNAFFTVDVSSDNIIIPEGKDVYIGYGLVNTKSGSYPFSCFGPYDADHGGFYHCSGFMANNHTWSSLVYENGYYDAVISATLSTSEDVEFSALGVSYIRVEDGVPSVVLAAGKSLKETEWYLDGTLVETPAAVNTLESGSHVYMVRLSYYDGTSERIFYEVDK